MTSITTYPVRRRRVSSPISSPSPLFAALQGFVSSAICQWRSYRELRAIESLPEGLLKDIGWPSGKNER